MMPSINVGGLVALGWLALVVAIAPLLVVVLVGRRLHRPDGELPRWFRIGRRAVIGGYLALAALMAVGAVVNLIRAIGLLSESKQ